MLTSAAAPAAFASKHEKGGKGRVVDLQPLAFNDDRGHLDRTTLGSVAGEPAGGSEFLSAKLNELRKGNRYSLTVAAGDLIGGPPAFSGLFHDEPSVESLNAMDLDISSVGNHEFDELLRMQNGGCHPVDGCYFPDEPYEGADLQWLSANVVETATGETPLPPYETRKVRGVKVASIGIALEATDTLVAAAGIQGYDFLDEAETANALVPILKKQKVEAIVVLLHEGGSQTPRPATSTPASASRGRSWPSTTRSTRRSTPRSPVAPTCRTTACWTTPPANRASSRAPTHSGAWSPRSTSRST